MTQWGLDTLFNPAKRHMDEEKRRLQSTREQVGDNSGGKRIDLDSNKVVIDGTADDHAVPGGDADTESDEAAEARAEREKQMTPAQRRAAERRRRARG